MGRSEKDSKNKNMLITLVIWCVLCSACMAGMLAVASDKTIIIEDAAQKQAELPTDSKQLGAVRGAVLELQEERFMERLLCIPIGAGIKAEDVTVENKYVNQELWIYIKKAEEAFYQENNIIGDVASVKKCWYELQDDGLLLKMRMDTVWEYHSTMENGSLKIAFSKPRDNYRQIVVLDPIGGGSDSGITVNGYSEKELALQVAKLVPKKLEQPEIKVYITRGDDTEMSEEQRLKLVQAVEPDLFLQIRASQSIEDPEQYGIQAYYNDAYFIPDFGNVEWADAVTKKVTVSVSNRALGLFPASEESILKQLNMPAASISVGYLTNEQEKSLLAQTGYQEKLATGIAEAILEVYTNSE